MTGTREGEKKRAEFSQHFPELGLSPAHQAWNKETTTSRALGVRCILIIGRKDPALKPGSSYPS